MFLQCEVQSSMRRHLLLTLIVALRTASALEVSLPPETASFKPRELPGYTLVQRDCLICHSAHSGQSQPSPAPRAYWEATVKKMQKPFGAPFPDDDIPAIVDYLVKTYGTE